MALLLLHLRRDVDLLGITTVFGNASIDITTRNALYLCEKFAIDVPVARGAGAALVRPPRGSAPHVHGEDGLGNLPTDTITTTREPDARTAQQLMLDILRAHPGEVTIVAVGPLTNLAVLLAESPDAARLVRRVVVMGGAFGGGGVHSGNVSPVAEANICGDPHAADAVFTAEWPVAIAGLDVTERVVMSADHFTRLRDAGGVEGAFLWEISRLYVGAHARLCDPGACFVHDSTAVAFLLAPELFETRRAAVRVVTDGIAVGQTILCAEGRRYSHGQAWEGVPPQTVLCGVKGDDVAKLYVDALTREWS